MTGQSSAVLATIKVLQTLLVTMDDTLGLGKHLCPLSASIDAVNARSFDIIVAGGGSAGLVVANELAKTSKSVLIIEEGPCAPLESYNPGVFTLVAKSRYDRNFNMFNDNYSSQSQKPEGGLTAGKMLGGSGSLDHMIVETPNKDDHVCFAKAANDESWKFDNFLKYYQKIVSVEDKGMLEQNTFPHGTSGPIAVTKQESDANRDIIDATGEIGFPYKNDTFGVCTTQPALAIDKCGRRQWGTFAHLGPLVGKKNVFILTATVSKILFEGTTATGVEYISNGVKYTVKANNQVILSTGALRSPQLLMLSGIGDKKVLDKFGIDTVVDNPQVGQNMQDSPGVLTGMVLDDGTPIVETINPGKFPVPIAMVHDALDKTQTQPDVKHLILKFTPGAGGLLQVLSNVFNCKDSVTDTLADANTGKNFNLLASVLLNGESSGNVTLQSADVKDQPLITMGTVGNTKDVKKLAQIMFNFFKPLLDTNTYKKLGATMVDLGVCKEHEQFSLDFWSCYVVEMSVTMKYLHGTCAVGQVTDSNYNVIGTKKLKVVDASVIPCPISGFHGLFVRAMAAKCADTIKNEYGLSDDSN